MPEWIHERAKHISAKNPSMPESEAWAIATQQSHALGKSPKGYGTAKGKRVAKQKYDTPKDDKKTDNPGDLSSKKVAGIAIQYDLEGRPKSAETSDEWLAAHFRDTGTFMIPDRLKDSRVDFIQSKCAEVRGAAFLDELGRIAWQDMMNKSGAAIAPEEAEESLARYERMQSQKPSAGQLGRYATLGAVAVPTVRAVGNLISGGKHWTGASKKDIEALRSAGKSTLPLMTRNLAASSTTGALGSGVIPLARSHLDQMAEKQKLKSFLQQYEAQRADGDGGELKTSAVGPESNFTASEYSTPIEGPKRARQASHIPPGHKTAGIGAESSMTTSEFSGPLSYGGFPQVSAQYSPRTQTLQERPFEQPGGGRVSAGAVMVPAVKTAIALTPQGRFSAAAKMGKTPGVLGSRGPSIAQVAKPDGFGKPAAGAVKS